MSFWLHHITYLVETCFVLEYGGDVAINYIKTLTTEDEDLKTTAITRCYLQLLDQVNFRNTSYGYRVWLFNFIIETVFIVDNSLN